jgi:tetratricopeptide (TPR) repeat protein
VKLQKKNAVLADNYFALALVAARTSGTHDIFDNLGRLAFPESTDSQAPFVSDIRLRRNLLEILSDKIKIESQEVLEKSRTDCALTVDFGRRFLAHYESIAPQRLPVINQAINICQISLAKDENNSSPFDEKPQTIEEFLSAAEKTGDKNLKAKYLRNAAMLAERKKEYTRAIDILFQIDADMRDKPFGVWEAILLNAATPLLVQSIESDNLEEMYALFKKLPDVTRTLIRVSVISKLNEKNHRLLGRELLDEARQELGKIDFKPVGKDVHVLLASPTMFGQVVNFYDKFGYQNEAIDTYDETIKVINRFVIEIPSEDRNQKAISQPINWGYFGIFNGPLFDTHFLRIDQAISRIDFRPIRLKVRYQWLKVSLKKQAEIEEEIRLNKSKNAAKARQK